MGAPKLQITLAKGALGGPPVFFSMAMCNRIVGTYRNKNFRIRDGWGICTRIIEDMAHGIEGHHKCISWTKNTIFLPNGKSLRYPELRDKRVAVLVARKMDPDTDDGEDLDMDRPYYVYESKGVETKLYGGKLCENIVQFLARIIVMGQLLEISKTARVVMTTHDEVVTCVKKAQAELNQRRMLKIMATSPDWWPDIPLAAEGGFATNYSK